MSDQRLRVGVFGLGMMGRNHARVLSTLDEVALRGAADPAGDRFKALVKGQLYLDADELLRAGIDAAVVAIPTSGHEALAVKLAAKGIATLIEKPVAPDVRAASRIREAFALTGTVVSVGHIERFNPALMEMKRRLDAHELGSLFSIYTSRIGPFPKRIQDVGVVKDLATHDIDLVSWLVGRPISSVYARTAHRMGRPNEDLVTAICELEPELAATISVNWLTPMKQRIVTVIGERGAFVADLLTADLFFHANADHETDWDELVHLRGVTEGNMIRYAFPKREPLVNELSAFVEAAQSGSQGNTVSIDDGISALRVAQAMLVSASTGQPISLNDHRPLR